MLFDVEGTGFTYLPGTYTGTNFYQMQSIDALYVLFNCPLQNSAPDNAGMWTVLTNTTMLNLDATRGVPQLVWSDIAGTNASVQVWKKQINPSTWELDFWNRTAANVQNLSFTANQLGLPNALFQNTELFQMTNYTWTGTLAVTLTNAQSHFVLCTLLPANPFPYVVNYTNQANQYVGTFTAIQTTAALFNWALIPLFSAIKTNYYVGPWTNGTYDAIYSNTASTYAIKQLAP
jgi:hypothetical protein